jgi:hypothetical protein
MMKRDISNLYKPIHEVEWPIAKYIGVAAGMFSDGVCIALFAQKWTNYRIGDNTRGVLRAFQNYSRRHEK